MGLQSVGAPVFDIGRNTSYLMYCQAITWFGLYYSPLLPLITVIILLVTFYIKRLSLKVNCQLSGKTWVNSTSTTVFLVVAFIKIVVAGVAYLYVISSIKQSKSCGPFRSLEGKPLNVINTNIGKEWIGFLVQPGVVGGATVVLLVVCYYVASLSQARKIHRKELKKQLKMETEDLRFLRMELLSQHRKG